MVGETLTEPVYGMKGVACEGRGYFVGVVRLMEGGVNQSMVQSSMDPVDTRIGKQ